MTGRSNQQRLLFILNDAEFFVSHRLSLAKAALSEGYEVHIAVAFDANAVEVIEAAGIRFHDIPLKRGSRGPLDELRLIFRLAKVIRCLRPDMIHTVTMKPVLYGGSLARILKVPALLNSITGLGYMFLIEGRIANLQRVLIGLLYRFALHHPNCRTIFQNGDDFRLFVDRGLVNKKHAVIIKGTGVDMEKFSVLPEPKGRPVVMFPARLIGDKGIHEFIYAAKILKAGRQCMRFVIVGRPDPDNPTDVGESKIWQWEKEGLIEWWGFSENIADTLSRSHIVCMPSYREGLPRILIEAAACGRPIITADVPGCREIVKDGVNGLLVPVKDGAATARAIKTLALEKEIRHRMGQRSRQIAEAEYNLPNFIGATLRIYKVVNEEGSNAV